MRKDFNITTSYCFNGKYYMIQGLTCDHFDITVSLKEEVIKVMLYPKVKMSEIEINMECVHLFTPQAKIFVNGYQSWTDSKEFNLDEKMPKTSFPFSLLKVLKAYGDESFVKYPTQKGVFHGFTYGYVRELNKVFLFGSMSEKNGYTIIKFNSKKNQIVISKDLEGVEIKAPYEVFNIGYFEGEYDEVFDRYFSLQQLPAPRLKRARGYTSWYNYYTNVTKKNIVEDLISFKTNNIDIDLFQIDDGYQTKVGDWLSIKEDFGDMKEIANMIHSHKIKAGLWLAPFACVKESKIFKEHHDWLLKDKDGKLVKGGLNWSNTGFYVLDILKAEVQAHLRNVFNVVLNEWGFDMVKLDFLYAACIVPRNNKSRGQIMCEAMDFIRDCCKNKLILGCGVPLGPSFGKVDFCRIGCDVDLKWANSSFERKLHRERVSTVNTLNNTIFRRHLNNRAFINDPDVFFLRDYNIKLTDEQKSVICDVNKLFGGVLFVSDNISTYTDKKLKILEEVFKDDEIEIVSCEYMTKTLMSIEYTINGIENQQFIFDMQNGNIVRE